MADPGSTSEDRLAEERASRISSRQAADNVTRRIKYFDEIPVEALLWMALVPNWTLELARACHFPEGEMSLEKTLDRMVKAKIVNESRPISIETLEPTSTVYTMNDSIRYEMLDEYHDHPERLRETMSEIGRRMIDVYESAFSKTLVPPILSSLIHWASLASRVKSYSRFVEFLDDVTTNAFELGDSAEILDWIEAGRFLARVLASDLDSPINISLQQAGRKLELLHRREQDKLHLKFFLERDEQVKAFERLMKGDDKLWALHYIGGGALGKTLLMRHITTNLSPRFGAVAARIDFDYLNADYPSRSPGLLVWSFAQELQAYDQGTLTTRRMDRAGRELSRLQQKLQSDQSAYRWTIRDPQFRTQFQELLTLFIDVFKSLKRPVILILDTCEELARTSSEGAPMENVEETFRILRALHDGPEALDNASAPPGRGLPDLRVIFAGRRPLAQAGYKWFLPSSSLPFRLSSSLSFRPYLRLHQIRGFPHDEAGRYLRKILEIPDPLVPAIIQQSNRDGGGVDIDWESPEDRPPDVPRCNPYILRLYADWAKEDTSLTAEDIANATDDKFVEQRIIERLRRHPGDDKLNKLLPAIALLRHFDKETLQAVTNVENEEFASLFERLCEQEWISQRRVSRTDGKDTLLVLDLEPGLQQRLLDYLTKQSSGLSQVRELAADYLEGVTLQHKLAELDWSFFDAALRVLEPYPERAVAWWAKVVDRILSERDFRWVESLTSFLTGTDGAVGPSDTQIEVEQQRPESPLRLDVLATQAAAFLHTNAKTAAASVWLEIAQKAKNHPVPSARIALQLRALAGGITTSDSPNLGLQSTQVQMLWEEVFRLEASTLDAQVAAALVAATEAVVEHVEELITTDSTISRSLWLVSPPIELAGGAVQQPGPVHLAELLYAPDLGKSARHPWQQHLEAIKGLQVFAATLAARALEVAGEYSQAQNWFLLALSGFQESDAVDMSATWADWLPPDNLAARVRLEFIRASYPAQLSPSETLAAAGPWQGSPTATDTERLRSAMLRLRLADGPVLDEIVFPGSTPGLTPFPATCYAHRETLPLFTTLNELLAANGYVDDALPQLRLISQQSTSFDLDTIRHAERVLLRIIRRMRLRDERESGGSSLLSSGQVNDYLLLWTLDGLDGARNQGPIPDLPPMITGGLDRLKVLHAIWRTRFTSDPERITQTHQWASTHLAAFQTLVPTQGSALDFLLSSLYMDTRELALISEESRERNVPQPLSLDPSTWWLDHPNQPVEALSLWLRIQALEPLHQLADSGIPQSLLSRIGLRRAAEVALDEGELLGLRLPERALVMLELAATWFDACGDLVGVVLARTDRAMILARRKTVEAGEGAVSDPDNSQELWTELDKVKTPYDSFVSERQSTPKSQQWLPLPSWQDLVTLGRTPDDKGLESLGPPGWRPWLVRLVTCLIRGERRRTPELESGAEEILKAWLTNHYGSTVSERVELPADFAGLFAAPSVNAEWLAAGERGALIDTGMKTLGGPSNAYGSVTTIDHSKLIDFAEVRISGGVTVGDVAGGNISKINTSTTPSLIRLDISSASPSMTAYRSPTATQTVSLRLVEALPGQEQAVPSAGYNGVCQTVGTAPYRMLANNLPPEFSMALQLWVGIGAVNKPEVTIRVEPGLDGPCWEAALLLAAVVQLPGSSDFPFRFRRVGTGSRSPRTRISSPIVRVLSCAANDEAQNVAKRGWDILFKDPLFTFQVNQPSILSEPTAWLNDVSVLHLIGTVEETTSGIRFRFSDEQAYLRQVFEQKTLSSIGDVNPSDLLIRAADLARLLPNMALCIIQGAVEQGLDREATTLRGDVDRRDAILARVFASELFAQGIPAVLVIPPLVPQSGVSALERLATALQERSQPIGQALIDTLASIQTLILTGADALNHILPALQPGGESEAMWEQAFDACLYLAPDFGVSSSLLSGA